MNRKVDVVIKAEEDKKISNEIHSQRNIPVNKISAIAKGYLRYIDEMEDDDDSQAREDLYSLMERFSQQTEQSGDADDFHNFSVALAVKDEYALACDVLQYGLRIFPKNVDLLADYLKYGLNCGRLDEVKNVFKTLNRIPRMRWTWRAFDFSITYLRNLIEGSDSQKEIDAKIEEIKVLLGDFRKYHSDMEETYRVEAETFHSINMKKEELNTLKSAMDNLNIAPKCALRYADLQFENGNYEEATKAIKRCIGDSTGTQTSVNEGYIYYLYGLSILACHQKKNMALNEEVVLQIYSNFNVALIDLRNSNYQNVIKTKTNTLINTTGVEIPVEYEKLRDLVLQ